LNACFKVFGNLQTIDFTFTAPTPIGYDIKDILQFEGLTVYTA